MTNPLFLIFLLSIVFSSAYILNRIYFDGRFVSLNLLGLFFLYLIPAITCAIGILSINSIVTLSLIIFFASLLLYRKHHHNITIYEPFTINLKTRFFKTETITAALAGSVIFFCSLDFLINTVWYHIVNIHPFNLDAVKTSYPMLINIIQTGTAWSVNYFYSSNLLGYEMIQAWGILFLKNEALVGLFHYYYLFLLLFFSCGLLKKLLGEQNNTIDIFSALSYFCLLACLLFFPTLLRSIYQPFGKTDLPVMTYSVIASFFFFDFINDANPKKWYDKKLLLFSLALHLMVSVKPQGLIYAFCLTAVFCLYIYRNRLSYSFLFAPVFSVFLSSVWYLRLLIGRSATHADIGFETIILYNLFNPKNPIYKTLFPEHTPHSLKVIMFSWNSSTITLVSIVAILLLLLAGWSRFSFKHKMAYLLVWGNILALALTPTAVWWPKIHLRHSLSLFPVFFILIITVLNIFTSAIKQKYYVESKTIPVVFNFRHINKAFILLILSCLLIQGHNYSHPDGFPGWAGCRNENSPEIYKCAFENIENQKIGFFSGGRSLLLYGLFGKNFSNRIFTGREYLSGLNYFKTNSIHNILLDDLIEILIKEELSYMVCNRDKNTKTLINSPELFQLVCSNENYVVFKFLGVKE